mmetsp:Transcript_58814/g.102932  ORF Transcript_58814/g.102932 Transcript_58814/m.102932 type:complete len:151 (+) Transcript_58814:953-1405(+)
MAPLAVPGVPAPRPVGADDPAVEEGNASALAGSTSRLTCLGAGDKRPQAQGTGEGAGDVEDSLHLLSEPGSGCEGGGDVEDSLRRLCLITDQFCISQETLSPPSVSIASSTLGRTSVSWRRSTSVADLPGLGLLRAPKCGECILERGVRL